MLLAVVDDAACHDFFGAWVRLSGLCHRGSLTVLLDADRVADPRPTLQSLYDFMKVRRLAIRVLWLGLHDLLYVVDLLKFVNE